MSENSARGFNRRLFLKGTAAASLGTAAAAAGVTPRGVCQRRRPRSCPPSHLTAPSYAAWTWSSRAPRPRVASGSCSRTSRRSQPRIRCSTAWVRPWRKQPTADAVSTTERKRRERRLRRKPQPTPHIRVHFRWSVHRPRHHLRHHDARDQQSDPYATTNFRTPRYDLDAIYGLGPSTNPQFYDPNDRDKFLIVERPYSQITGTLKMPDGVDEAKTWDVKPDVV